MELTCDGTVAVLRMEAGKGNAMSPGFVARLGELVAGVPATGAGSMVVTGEGSIFSAGLDLPELLARDRKGMSEFIHAFDRTMEAIFSLPLPVVAAINGHAIAGGCVLALQCDRRLRVSGRGKIGLTEVTLGIGLPPCVIEVLPAATGAAAIFPLAQEGKLVDADTAHSLGLVDELLSADQLLPRAMELATELGCLGREGYAQVKLALREPVIARIHARRDAMIETWLDTWFSSTGQERLHAVVKRLAEKS